MGVIEHDFLDTVKMWAAVFLEALRTHCNKVIFTKMCVFLLLQDELFKELEELEQEELDEQLLDVGPSVTSQLPDVPTARPGKTNFPNKFSETVMKCLHLKAKTDH